MKVYVILSHVLWEEDSTKIEKIYLNKEGAIVESQNINKLGDVESWIETHDLLM